MTTNADAPVFAVTRPRRKKVAVMQPYFFPYAGYFRLFEAVDEFVIFDCVQFPRRGRVHRTELPGAAGRVEWLTLPLARQARSTEIRDLAFAAEARARFDERLARYQWIATSRGPAADELRAYLGRPLDSVIDFLTEGLRLVARLLEFDVVITRSSDLRLDAGLCGQDRVIAAARAVGATDYVNSPGGRALYDGDSFAEAGLSLSFLCPYDGAFAHLLPALMQEPLAAIRDDIVAGTRI